MPKGKPQPPTSGRSVPTSVRLGAETRALWAELAGWWQVSQASALAVLIRRGHAAEAKERERRATREKRT